MVPWIPHVSPMSWETVQPNMCTWKFKILCCSSLELSLGSDYYNEFNKLDSDIIEGGGLQSEVLSLQSPSKKDEIVGLIVL